MPTRAAAAMRFPPSFRTLSAFCIALAFAIFAATTVPLGAALVSLDSAGRLKYAAGAEGNVIPDFSHCGYAAGEKMIPFAAVKISVRPQAGDSDGVIQAAIDKVSAMPLGPDGMRGAVLLRSGRHKIAGTLSIGASGVVLRGEGPATILFASAIDVLCGHYPKFKTSDAASAAGKPIWACEDGPWRGDWVGAQKIAEMSNRNYVQGRMTKTITWSLVSSYYDVLRFPDSGMMLAKEP